MIPFPIIIQHNTSNPVTYTYPQWVQVFLIISLLIFIVGGISLIVCLIMNICFDKDFDLLFRISMFLLLVGAIFLIISVCCMALTGTPVPIEGVE